MKTKTFQLSALYWASFNCFELRLPGEAVEEIAQSGANDAAVSHWAPLIAEQVTKDNFPNRPTPEKIRAELKEHGAWNTEELANDAKNWERLVWLAAWDIFEEESPDCSDPVPPITEEA